MATITDIQALEILDSRGNPTVRVSVLLDDGGIGVASVPSGASTGEHEAHELRDGDEKRYGGKGVTRAVGHVRKEIREALLGQDPLDQRGIDDALIALDGTEQKERLGANAILGTSLAVSRAAAKSLNLALYRYIGKLHRTTSFVLPRIMVNVINGGQHADSGLDIQEYLIIPSGKNGVSEAVRTGSEVFHALNKILRGAGHVVSVGDEGGFAPKLERNDEAFPLLIRAVEDAGYVLERDVVFGIDAAASEFYNADESTYMLHSQDIRLSREQLIALYADWMRTYPLTSIEDPLDQNDWKGWADVTAKLGKDNAQIVGDDFLVTSVERIQKATQQNACNAVLIKLNQIGTLSETLDAIRITQKNGWGVVVSHRSGETSDTYIADLVVGTSGGQIKTGSMSRSDRVEKYNRLMEIEQELGNEAQVVE